MSDDGESGFGLVMPFTICTSQGGPHADKPFVSGYRLGHLDARLELAQPAIWENYVDPSEVGQVDLIAMRHGYAMAVEEYDAEWSQVTLTRSTAKGRRSGDA
jgi:hypothetical protein